jgi:hypothetical protein
MHRLVSLLILGPFLVSVALAQSGQTDGSNEIDYETARLSRIAYALAIAQPIEIDGRLDEEAWQRAEPIGNFVQWGNSWDPGGPPSQPTEVRFLFDGNNLYVGAICYEDDIANMIVNGLKRDFQSNQGDELGFIVDTLNDDRSGFFFSTNPAGARRDLQLANDSQINQEWDGVWDVRVRVEEDRWVARVGIERLPKDPQGERGSELGPDSPPIPDEPHLNGRNAAGRRRYTGGTEHQGQAIRCRWNRAAARRR